MKEIFLINGSPRAGGSNTLKLAEAFTGGMEESGEYKTVLADIYKKDLQPCRGCFSCWRGTAGKCVIKDDMAGLLEEYIRADVVVWSFPLYYFLMPSGVKLFFDRMLPLNCGEIEKTSEETSTHKKRYDLSGKRHVLICTSGFSTKKDNYEHLLSYFRFLFDDLTTILCPEGELFRVKELEERTGEYLGRVRRAGREFAGQGHISTETAGALEELILPEGIFLEMANKSWGN